MRGAFRRGPLQSHLPQGDQRRLARREGFRRQDRFPPPQMRGPGLHI